MPGPARLEFVGVSVLAKRFRRSGGVRHLRHLTARSSAAYARFCARLHHVVVREAGAVTCAALADIRANAARLGVEVRGADHEVRARLADFDAVEHQADVVRSDVLATHLQAVLERRQAHVMTVLAYVYSLLHLRGGHIHVGHRQPPVLYPCGSVQVYGCDRGALHYPDGVRWRDFVPRSAAR